MKPAGSEEIHFRPAFRLKFLVRILKIEPQDLTLPGPEEAGWRLASSRRVNKRTRIEKAISRSSTF